MTNLKPNWLRYYINCNKRDLTHELDWLKDESSRLDFKDSEILNQYLHESIALCKKMLKRIKDESK